MDLSEQGLRGLIFDKDGTLFDFNATWGAWARKVFEHEAGGDPDRLIALTEALGYDLAEGVFRPDSIVIASTIEEVAQVALPLVEETSVQAIIDRFNAAAIGAPQVEAASLRHFVDRLKAAGFRMGVATNDAERPARAHLAEAGVEEAFDFIAGYDSGFGGKPAPGQLLAFCDTVGLAPDQCAMIGDSTHDLKAGRAAGMICIAVLTGVAGRDELAPFADVVLPSIAELPKALGL